MLRVGLILLALASAPASLILLAVVWATTGSGLLAFYVGVTAELLALYGLARLARVVTRYYGRRGSCS